jgi:hypothetical protein
MENNTPDNSVLSHITKLTEMHKIKLELDQYWDLLRQRRALRDAGEDPNQAEKRSVDQIENYEE